jgi:hypothetical protein
MTGSLNWNRMKKHDAVLKARRQNLQEIVAVNKIANQLINRERRLAMKHGCQIVDKIHWVKDTPFSLTTKFLEWREKHDK